MIDVKINVSKIDKDRLFEGDKGTYLDIIVAPRKGTDQYGNTHTVYMKQTEDERKAKADKIYLGSGRLIEFNKPQQEQSFTPTSSEDKPLPF